MKTSAPWVQLESEHHFSVHRGKLYIDDVNVKEMEEGRGRE
jgi:hypothetical protein